MCISTLKIYGKPSLTVDSVVLFFFFYYEANLILGCLFKHKCASVIEHATKLFTELLFDLKHQ